VLFVDQERMAEARDLFRNESSTEFVIVTIPTVMAVSESCRLAGSLKKEGVPLHTIVVNQVHLDALMTCSLSSSCRRLVVNIANFSTDLYLHDEISCQ
jgi:arsenite-transporting ATPase